MYATEKRVQILLTALTVRPDQLTGSCSEAAHHREFLAGNQICDSTLSQWKSWKSDEVLLAFQLGKAAGYGTFDEVRVRGGNKIQLFTKFNPNSLIIEVCICCHSFTHLNQDLKFKGLPPPEKVFFIEGAAPRDNSQLPDSKPKKKRKAQAQPTREPAQKKQHVSNSADEGMCPQIFHSNHG